MSDNSSVADTVPSDVTLKKALRTAIQKVYRNGNLEELTVRRVRKSAECALGLRDDFFKYEPTWKERSKDFIQSEVNAQANASSKQTQSSPTTKKQARPSTPQSREQHKKPQARKRAATEDYGNRKRRKTSDDSGKDTVISDAETPQKKQTVPKTRAQPLSRSVSPFQEDGDINNFGLSEKVGVTDEHSESEMSEVLDEAPKTKRKDRKSGSPKPRARKAGVSKTKKTSEEPIDADAEEIKRLQGWLVKCGIRKMWWKELQPYDTPKAKIRHLKGMLTDAGMTGRYSAEKASQIKEERELKADLEAVQEGNKNWGKTASEEEEPATGRPRRKLAKGLQGLDFLNDSDGEETD